MTAPAAQTGYTTTAWRAVTGLVIGAAAALLLSEGLVAVKANIAELTARSRGQHIFLSPALQIGIGWQFVGLYIAAIVAACAPVWLALHRWKRASWPAAIVLGLVATAAAWGLSGAYRDAPDALGVGLPLLGAFSGWLVWRVSYHRGGPKCGKSNRSGHHPEPIFAKSVCRTDAGMSACGIGAYDRSRP